MQSSLLVRRLNKYVSDSISVLYLKAMFKNVIRYDFLAAIFCLCASDTDLLTFFRPRFA